MDQKKYEVLGYLLSNCLDKRIIRFLFLLKNNNPVLCSLLFFYGGAIGLQKNLFFYISIDYGLSYKKNILIRRNFSSLIKKPLVIGDIKYFNICSKKDAFLYTQYREFIIYSILMNTIPESFFFFNGLKKYANWIDIFV